VFLPIHPKDWVCRAPGRKDHYRVLFCHPVTGRRKLRCPDCQSEEIQSWFRSSGDEGYEYGLTDTDKEFLRAVGIRAE
jgi:hypothetical protein